MALLRPKNEVESTLSAAFTRGTSTTIDLDDASDFPTSGVVRIDDGSEWCLLKYSGKSTNSLTGLSDAEAVNVSSGGATYTWPIGTSVTLVQASDYLNAALDVLQGDAPVEGTLDFGGHSADNLLSWPDPGGVYNVLARSDVHGDGTTDDQAGIQAAIDAVHAAGGGTVYFPCATYRVDSTLTLYSNIRLLFEPGACIDFSNAATGDVLFEGAGTLGTSSTLSADASEGDTSISVTDETGFSAGDLVIIHSAAAFYSSISKGEYHYVKSIATGTLNLADGLWDSYATADSATVHKVNPISNIVIENAWIRGGGASSEHVGIRIDYGEDILIKNLRSEDMEDRAVDLVGCVNAVVDGATVLRSNRDSYGYGVAVLNSQWVRVVNSYFGYCRHGVTVGGVSSYYGPTRFLVVANNEVYGATDAGLDAHPSAQYLVYCHNTVSNAAGDTEADGIIIQATDAFIANNIICAPARHGLYLQPLASRRGSFTVFNNQIYNAGTMGIILMVYSGATVDNLVISANTIEDPGNHGIYLSTYQSGSSISQFSITNNTIRSAGGKGIWVYAQNASIANGAITGNVVKDSAAENIHLYSSSYTVTYVTVTGNQESGGTYGVRGVATDYISVTGNVYNGSGTAVSVAGSNSVTTGNVG